MIGMSSIAEITRHDCYGAICEGDKFKLRSIRLIIAVNLDSIVVSMSTLCTSIGFALALVLQV